jgi:endonuclease III
MRNWAEDLEPLLIKYGKQKHPLDYADLYQFLVMIVLAAQASDNQINRISGKLFEAYPSFRELKNSTVEDLYPFISSVRGFRKKAKWLTDIAQIIGDEGKIPSTLEELTRLPGIGRKTANAIIREAGGNAEGIMVDLHVLRVAPRLGVATSEKPDKVEKDLMNAIPREKWNDIGMALSFHGRETCRPKPECERCIVNSVCNYYNTVVKPKA